ncbi:MAG: type VI secretion system tip protein VgrG [Pyrinomonadaceae bacterium]|nr:type VI secretion system tip protein VgrG [Pyrinomonadaceae bacterium]
MKTTQNERLLKIATPLGEDFLLLQRMTFTEGLSRLFEGELELWHDEGEAGYEPTFINPERILGKPVTIRIEQNDGVSRYFCGIINEFEQGGRDNFYSVYQARIVPHIWMLTQNLQSRIFQNISVPDILRKLLNWFDCAFELQHNYEPRNYCVQYQETDFAFISRLMEEEGIYYYFKHSEKTHQLVIADTPQSHLFCPSKSAIEYHDESFVGDEGVGSAVRKWRWHNKWRTGKVRLWDYNFQLPTNKLSAEQPSLFLNGNKELEVYEFPAGYARKLDGIAAGGGEQGDKLQKIFDDRQRTVQVRMEEIDVQNKIANGISDCSNLTVGFRFDLKNHPVSANNSCYVLTNITHEAVQTPAYQNDEVVEQAYNNQFDCITYGAGQAPFRPQRITPKPLVRGSQTATVVGPAGEEIFTDKYGRVKVQFHWDREGKYNEGSSCWIRVGQLWAGKKWGSMFIPRVGMEVIVDFIEGDPDQPIITGTVYNPETMPPYNLPEEKTKSGIKTDSTTGGGGFNELRFEDKKGEEQFFIHAEKNMDVRVKNDSFEFIGHDRHLIVKNEQFEKVEKDKHLKVGGDRNEEVKGSVSLKVGSDEDIQVGAKFAVDARNEIHLKSGTNLVIETGTNLTLQVGSNFININSTGIYIKATMIMLNSGGAAGSGSGANPDPPKDAKEADKAKAGERVKKPTLPPPVKPQKYSQAAMVLKKAAKEGSPFCEVCNRKK